MRFQQRSMVLLPVLFLAACQQPAVMSPTQTPVERGEYLVSVAGCHDCHSPKVFTNAGPDVDDDRFLAGHPTNDPLTPVPDGLIAPDAWGAVTNNHLTAWAGPWGVSFAMNLTPDVATGLGSWNEDMFISAIRTGKHQGTGRDILPPMPWNWYRNMTDEDLAAIFAYLQSLPAVDNPVPEPLPPDRIPQ